MTIGEALLRALPKSKRRQREERERALDAETAVTVWLTRPGQGCPECGGQLETLRERHQWTACYLFTDKICHTYDYLAMCHCADCHKIFDGPVARRMADLIIEDGGDWWGKDLSSFYRAATETTST